MSWLLLKKIEKIYQNYHLEEIDFQKRFAYCFGETMKTTLKKMTSKKKCPLFWWENADYWEQNYLQKKIPRITWGDGFLLPLSRGTHLKSLRILL